MATIGKVLLSYDVSDEWNEVRISLIELGYSTLAQGETKTYELPNTTLTHQSKSVKEAIKDLKRICENLNIHLQKAIAVLVRDETDYYNH
jgi:hypothetical protein